MEDKDYGLIPDGDVYDSSNTLWTRAFVTFLLVYFCTFMSFYMQFSTLSPYFASEGLSKKMAGLVIGSFTLTSIASRLLSAPLAVRFGPLFTARIGLAVIAFGIVFYFISPGTGCFALARLLQGAGFGLVSTLLVSLVTRIIPHHRMGEGLGFMGLGSTVAMAMGPLAGLAVSAAFGYREMFLSMDLMLALSLLVTLQLPKFLEAKDPPPPPAPQGAPRGLRRLDTRPMWPGSLSLFYGAAVSAVTIYLTLYCREKSLPSAAAFFVVATIGTAIARFTTGRICDRKGPVYVVPPFTLLLAAALAGILYARSAPVLFLAALCYGASAGAIFPALQSFTISTVERSRRTVAAATFFIFYDLGNGIGVVLLGYLAGHFGNYSASFEGSLCFTGLLFLGFLIVYGRSRLIGRRASEAGDEGADEGRAAEDGSDYEASGDGSDYEASRDGSDSEPSGDIGQDLEESRTAADIASHDAIPVHATDEFHVPTADELPARAANEIHVPGTATGIGAASVEDEPSARTAERPSPGSISEQSPGDSGPDAESPAESVAEARAEQVGSQTAMPFAKPPSEAGAAASVAATPAAAVRPSAVMPAGPDARQPAGPDAGPIAGPASRLPAGPNAGPIDTAVAETDSGPAAGTPAAPSSRGPSKA
ncbi:MAG: MFS transporter [Deltaproteobacteria bacterium]|jgi:MFS family permease|nr:MFS transporter [Deltaproteobacteria bacterium]